MSFVRRSGRLNKNFNGPATSAPFSDPASVPVPLFSPNKAVDPMFDSDIKQPIQMQHMEKEPGNSSCSTIPFLQENEMTQRQESAQETMETQNAEVVLETNSDPPKEDIKKAIETSATTKALNSVEANNEIKKRWKKGKTPLSIRRKKLNQRLSKILAPKNALIFLHELKPSCVFRVEAQPGAQPPLFEATVLENEKVLGTGKGMTKGQARKIAAENAIKFVVSNTMTRNNLKNKEELSEEVVENYVENLPWAGMASYAMYKMFTEWQKDQETVLSIFKDPSKAKPKVKHSDEKPRRELPPNAQNLHPTIVLSLMKPGVSAVEINRENGKVTMGFSIDGQMFTGVGTNKKEGRKEAAKSALSSLYGLTYS